MSKADALVAVSPEYNHGYSGLLSTYWTAVSKRKLTPEPAEAGMQNGPADFPTIPRA
jgi:NAD(P)H-dependent FMN reductase